MKLSCQNCSILWEEHRKTFIYLPTTQLVFCAIWDCSDIALVIPYKLALIIPHSTDLTSLLYVYHRKDKHSGILLSQFHHCNTCISLLQVLTPWFKCFFSFPWSGTWTIGIRWLVFPTQHSSQRNMLQTQFSKALWQVYRTKHTGLPSVGSLLLFHLSRLSKALAEYSF